MSAVTQFFFRSPYEVTPTTTWRIIHWWESRRFVYNAVVGAAGLLSLSVIGVLSIIPPSPEHFPIPLIPILAYGVMANLFYCAGPIVDIVVNQTWGREYSAVGAALFRYGFAFAVGLTLLPIPVAVMAKAIFAFGSLFG